MRNDNTIADTRPLSASASSLINPSHLSLLWLPHGTVLSLSLSFVFSRPRIVSSLVLDACPAPRLLRDTEKVFSHGELDHLPAELFSGVYASIADERREESRRVRGAHINRIMPYPTYRIMHSCVAAHSDEVLSRLFLLHDYITTKKQERTGFWIEFPVRAAISVLRERIAR